ncbi:MAG: zinc-dependent peptidase [Cyclobacteriaceae bacterium]|nr:zinc-dependent peptidase [Cyclobacteriaceae bacterium]
MAIGYLLLLLLAIYILYNVFSSFSAIVRWYFGDYINTVLLLRNIDQAYKTPLQKYHSYYQRLKPSDKEIFEKRVQKFIGQKQFIARGGLPMVTDEMKSLIAGAAVQLTFGHPAIYLSHFKKILIYPDDYYSAISKQYHQGEVNAGGIIVLSWKNFVKGYIDDNDGRNLGLHEMAHALRLENAIRNEEYGFLDQKTLACWTGLCYDEIEQMNSGNVGFLRDYAATNSQEFFAVAVELFFEKSKEFRDWHPQMYATLAKMLNQDPLVVSHA